MYARHDGDVLSYPYVVSHHGVPFQRQFVLYRGYHAAPISSHNVERVGRGTVHAVVGAAHNEIHTFGNGTEIADNQSVFYEFIEVRDVFLKLVRTVNIKLDYHPRMEN